MSVFCAHTRLPPEWAADGSVVEAHLESLGRRWNQFGFQALIGARAAAGGVIVRYRLCVTGDPNPNAAHAAFRDDLDRALHGLGGAAAVPPGGDLAALAFAAETAAPGRPRVDLAYEADADWPGTGPPAG